MALPHPWLLGFYWQSNIHVFFISPLMKVFYWWQKSMMFSFLFVCFIATWCHIAWANLKFPGRQNLASNPGLFLPPSPKCRGYRHASHLAVVELHLHLLWTRVMIRNLLGSPIVVMSPEKALGSHQKMVQQILKHIAGAHHVHPGHPWSWRTKFMMKPWQPHISSGHRLGFSYHAYIHRFSIPPFHFLVAFLLFWLRS